jgi:hypothetical protein
LFSCWARFDFFARAPPSVRLTGFGLCRCLFFNFTASASIFTSREVSARRVARESHSRARGTGASPASLFSLFSFSKEEFLSYLVQIVFFSR